MSAVDYSQAGVYVFRCRRPGLFGRIPLIGRHFGYVGEGRVHSRKRDHLQGSVKYRQPAKPWADLDPTWYFIPLPYWKPLLLTVETLLILLFWPVYNDRKNRWNPRRIPLRAAKRQRGQRNLTGWSFNFRTAHAILWAVAIIGWVWVGGWTPWQ